MNTERGLELQKPIDPVSLRKDFPLPEWIHPFFAIKGVRFAQSTYELIIPLAERVVNSSPKLRNS